MLAGVQPRDLKMLDLTEITKAIAREDNFLADALFRSSTSQALAEVIVWL